MHKIICLSSGQYVKLQRSEPEGYSKHSYFYFNWKGISQSSKHLLDDAVCVDRKSGILLFLTLEAANWFIRRRLTYNSKRIDADKISFMRSMFEASDIPHWKTNKLEFEPIEDTRVNLLDSHILRLTPTSSTRMWIVADNGETT